MNLRVTALACLAALAAALPATASNDDDRAKRALKQAKGWMSAGGGPAHSGSSGAPWAAMFKERFESTTYYTVCVQRPGNRGTRRCRRGETDALGRDRISFAGYLSGKSGRWRAEWNAGGLKWRWKFRIR